VLILNPDIRVLPGSLRLLEEFLDRHPRAGAVGGYVNDKYLPKRFPTAGSLVLENVGFRPRRKRLTDRSEPVAVDQPAAAALLVRRQAYEDVGGFDERYYPAWYEDVDFCRRIKAAGWEIYFAPKAEFLHGGGYSAENLGAAAFARAYYSNQLRYARKHLACTAVFAIRASIAAGALGRMITRPRQAFAYGKVLIGAIGKW
jgi:GT2 family glycosyltransferase